MTTHDDTKIHFLRYSFLFLIRFGDYFELLFFYALFIIPKPKWLHTFLFFFFLLFHNSDVNELIHFSKCNLIENHHTKYRKKRKKLIFYRNLQHISINSDLKYWKRVEDTKNTRNVTCTFLTCAFFILFFSQFSLIFHMLVYRSYQYL